MAKIVFRLNGVPDEEADSVRDILSQQTIEFYETSAGRWGISIAAIWVKNDADFQSAREAIDSFQKTHRIKMEQQYQRDKENGNIPTVWQILRANPVMYFMYWVLIIAILIISIVPIFSFFNSPN